MEEKNIKEEIYKCSKCGLCQSVCPIFLVEKNEMYLPRGRYNVLNNLFFNSKKPSKKFFKDLDICLNCNACKNFCPSSIDSEFIFTELKNKYFRPFIPFWLRYKFILIFHLLIKFLIKNPLYSVRVQREIIKLTDKKTNVVYFQGCFNKYINPTDKNASLNLLRKHGYNVVKIMDNCCGLPFLSDGQIENFKKNSKKIIKSIPKSTKYIVTSCDSCKKTLLPIFENTPFKIISIEEIINNYSPKDDVYFYKPYSKDKYSGKLKLINPKGKYSLMENYFLFKHPILAKKILKSVFLDKDDIQDKTIISSCNLTIWGLTDNCRKLGINKNVIPLSEYIFRITP